MQPFIAHSKIGLTVQLACIPSPSRTTILGIHYTPVKLILV